MIPENNVMFKKYQNSTVRTLKLENIQESYPKNMVFLSIYNNSVLKKVGNLFKEDFPKNVSESTIEAMDR